METERLCRLCRSSNDVILCYIFRRENMYILEEIEFLLKEKPSINDGLPPFICHRCSYKVQSHKAFRDLCTESWRQLQNKHTNSDEDDEIVILDEKPHTPTPPPCSSQYTRQTMFNVQDVRTLRPQDADLFMNEASSSSRTRHCSRYKLQRTHIEESFYKKRQHSPETSRLMRQMYQLQQQQQQQQQQQHRPEALTESGKLQHGLVGSPAFSSNLTETLPEVVNEQLGTVGYIVQDASSSQAPPFRRRMDVRPPHTSRVNGLHASSFSDSESRMQDPNKLIRLCCLGVPENSDIFGKRVMTRVLDSNDSNCTFLVQPSAQPRMHRPVPSFTEARASSGPVTCEFCGKVFTNRIIFKQHFKEKHIK